MTDITFRKDSEKKEKATSESVVLTELEKQMTKAYSKLYELQQNFEKRKGEKQDLLHKSDMNMRKRLN